MEITQDQYKTHFTNSGSSRIGSLTPTDNIRHYELTNHLGNVLTVVNDRIDATTQKPEIENSVAYEPFGRPMSRLSYYKDGANKYDFGFQSQENVSELFGGKASWFKYRISDNRLGRFFTIDPLASKYPHNSPYAFSENRVIDGVELEGKEWSSSGKVYNFRTRKYEINYTVKVKIENASDVSSKTVMQNFNTNKMLTEDILGNQSAKGSLFDPIVNVNIISSNDATLKVIYHGVLQNSNGNIINGNSSGNSQVGEINLSMSSDAMGSTAETFAHELGHSAGLNHPWEINSNSSESDAKQPLIPLVFSENVKFNAKNNLMNTGANPVKELKGRDVNFMLTNGQRQTIENTVQKEQKR